jgi:hypothetical protein
MKPTLLLLLSTLSTVAAAAQPIYHCDDGAGNLAIQDQPCAVMAVRNAAAVTSPNAFSDTSAAREVAYFAVRAEAEARLKRLLPTNVRDANVHQYASNRDRCASELRIVALCGSTGPTFSCDAKGFLMDPVSAGAAGPGSAFSIEQCGLWARRGSR